MITKQIQRVLCVKTPNEYKTKGVYPLFPLSCSVNRKIVVGASKLPYSEEFQLFFKVKPINIFVDRTFPSKGRSSDFVPASKLLPACCYWQWTLCLEHLKELTAAGQSGIFTPVPF